jgi:hypothetical protein
LSVQDHVEKWDQRVAEAAADLGVPRLEQLSRQLAATYCFLGRLLFFAALLLLLLTPAIRLLMHPLAPELFLLPPPLCCQAALFF